MSDAAPAAAAPAAAASTNGVTKSAPAKANGTAAPAPAKGATSGTGAPAQAVESATQPPASAEVDPLAQYLKTKGIEVKRRDGKAVKVTSPEQLQAMLGQAFGAAQEIEAARAARAELAQLKAEMQALEADPRAAMRRRLGADKFREVSEAETLEAFQEELELRNVPEHLRGKLVEHKRLKVEKEQLEAQRQRLEAEARQRQESAELESAREELMRDGVTALQAAGFSKSPPVATIYRVAPYLAEAKELGLGAEHAVALLKEDMATEFQQLASSFVADNDAAGLEAWLGPKVTEMLMRARVAKLRGAASAPPKLDAQGNTTQADATKDDVAADPAKLRAWLRGR